LIENAIDEHGWVTLSGHCSAHKKDCGNNACNITYVYYDKDGKITHKGKAAYTSGSGCED